MYSALQALMISSLDSIFEIDDINLIWFPCDLLLLDILLSLREVIKSSHLDWIIASVRPLNHGHIEDT